MPHLIKVQTAIVVECWVEVQGAADPEQAAPLAEAHATNEASTKYPVVEAPRSDAIGIEVTADPEGEPPALSCRTIPDPTPQEPPPAPKPMTPPKASTAPESAKPAPSIPAGTMIVDINLMKNLQRLRGAAENFLENEDIETLQHCVDAVRTTQVTIPLPPEIAALGALSVI